MESEGQRLLNLIAEHAGDDAVTSFLEIRGGGSVSLPGRPTDDHWFSQLVGGGEIARRIIEDMGWMGHSGNLVGLYIGEFPLGSSGIREKTIRELWRRFKLGQSSNVIAREVHIARRTVQRHRARWKKINQTSSLPTKGTTP